MGTVRAVWLAGHDREYEEHIRDNLAEFAGALGDIAPVEFACTAWRLSVAPASSPGYVRLHRRILELSCVRNEWDGTLIARANLVSPWPAALDWPRDWCRDENWQDWPDLFGQFVHPAERDIAKMPYLRASVLVEAPVPFTDLPPAPEHADQDVPGAARRAVSVLVRQLDALLTPIVEKLETRAGAPDAR
ncbi:hypothetical protein FPZ12_023690 [Amycolatopsis acidicola]|uniref:Uncharacterized protein n=1 Tax=Amycolatopsis acidicola TaxID=2596893 RepID=A0A5N0UXE7_9PSEU|nr:hypothetical protein [Amycolatopsis acidicola]KAA9158108.1 hypothetical protein FPZ12_023690 [Amycolatopsis acidicola]